MAVAGIAKKWSEDELEALGFNKIVIGVPGRPFPVMVPNPNAFSSDDVYRLEVIEDAKNPIAFWSKRPYEEVIGLLYRFLPTPSMLPLFYETLRLLRIENDRRIQFYIGRHGSGKSFAGKLIGDLLHPEGSVTINSSDRDLNELLFETVLDVSANPDLYQKINEKLANGAMSKTSIAALRNVVGSAYSEKDNVPFIDFEQIGSFHIAVSENEDGLEETEAVFNDKSAKDVVEVILKIAQVEGLSKEASFMPLKTQLGILPRVWQEGRVAHLEEYNKCKEGTDTCLHPVLQLFNGESSKCRVYGSGGMSFCFDSKDRKPGFFCYLDGNMAADGVSTHTLSASANDRLLPNIIQQMIREDWQHRWCQLLTGLPLKILYESKKDQWDADPGAFTRFCHMIRGLGGEEVSPIQSHYINRWENVIQATEMIAQYNYIYDQKTNPDSQMHKEARFPELFTEVDEEFYNMAGGSMRRVIKHLKQAMLTRPKTALPEESTGFDVSTDWKEPPKVVISSQTLKPEIKLGSSIVHEFYEDMVRLTLGLGKPKLHSSLKADFEALRLKRPDLTEGTFGDSLYFEDLLNSEPSSSDRTLVVQDILCDQLRKNYGGALAQENDFLMTLDMISNALHRASSMELPDMRDSRLNFVFVQDYQPLATVENLLASIAMLDGFPNREGKQLVMGPEYLISHERLMLGLALPKVGRRSQKNLWNMSLLNEFESPLASDDEAVRICCDESETQVAFTTVMTQKNENGVVSPSFIHFIKDRSQDGLLAVGDSLPEQIKAFLKEAEVNYVDRNASNARSKIQIFLNRLFIKRAPEMEALLTAAFLYRNDLKGVDLTSQGDMLDRLSISDLLTSKEVTASRPVYATAYTDPDQLQSILA